MLKFHCTPFEFIKWEDSIKRWLRGAQAHLTFDELVNAIFNKLDRQWQTLFNTKLKEGTEQKTTCNIFMWIQTKNWEQQPRIKRLQNCKELKGLPGEDRVNYETHVKR